MSEITCWTLLGVRPNASPEEVRAAFARRSRDVHPDAGGTGDGLTLNLLQKARDEALSPPAVRAEVKVRRTTGHRTAARPPKVSVRSCDYCGELFLREQLVEQECDFLSFGGNREFRRALLCPPCAAAAAVRRPAAEEAARRYAAKEAARRAGEAAARRREEETALARWFAEREERRLKEAMRQSAEKSEAWRQRYEAEEAARKRREVEDKAWLERRLAAAEAARRNAPWRRPTPGSTELLHIAAVVLTIVILIMTLAANSH